ncbi:MAG: hypothetical protein R3C61_00310 [Bacteroidia bacterium]
MKSIFISLIISVWGQLFPGSFTQHITSGPVKTTEFKVEGVCGMCKNRIENAALVKGVKMAEWDQKSHLLKVVFDARKISEQEIHDYVTQSGHDTEKVKASDENYKKLPACCAYRDGVEDHP